MLVREKRSVCLLLQSVLETILVGSYCNLNKQNWKFPCHPSADLDTQLVQLKHCDGEYRLITKMPYKENNSLVVMLALYLDLPLQSTWNIRSTNQKESNLKTLKKWKQTLFFIRTLLYIDNIEQAAVHWTDIFITGYKWYHFENYFEFFYWIFIFQYKCKWDV